MPIQNLVGAVDAPKEVKEAAGSLKVQSLIVVMLGINKDKLNDLSWLYISDKAVLTHRISFPSNYSPCVAPFKKSSVLTEITCNVGDPIWKMSDKAIVEPTVDDLSWLGLINKKDVGFAKVHRTQYAYVINDLNYNANLSIINNYFDEKGIGLVGRFSELSILIWMLA